MLNNQRGERMALRIKNIRLKLRQENLDGIIVSHPANISYLVNFLSRDAYFLVSEKQNVYFTDFRYLQEIKPRLKGVAALKKINGSVFKSIADACIKLGLKRIAFEERHLPFAEYKKIHEDLKDNAALIPTHGLIEKLREIKDHEEIVKIQKAVDITIEALKFIKNKNLVGKKEIEVVAELEHFIRHNGAYSSAFDIIVAGGANSSLPHHISSDRKIRNNEPLLIDIGVDYLGYKSDLTRVFFLGKINVLERKIYQIVLEAQRKAIEAVRIGYTLADVDKACRSFITQKGYGDLFGHSSGHGIGLEVHEEPHVSRHRDDPLRPGMIFTVEPAIYLPREFGIRIEDMVLVTKKGAKILSGILYK